jgi:hypothetical protein
MTDLITRLHREAERRGVVITNALPLPGFGDRTRHPLEIAHELLAKLPYWFQPVRSTTAVSGDGWVAYHPAIYTHGTWIECVVALAEWPNPLTYDIADVLVVCENVVCENGP